MPRLPGMTVKNVLSHCKSGTSMKTIAEKLVSPKPPFLEF